MPDETVGYGRPPKEFRFKKGHSGNPKGRPKRKPFSMADAIANILDGRTQYHDHGTIKTASRRELSIRKHVNLALNGDVRGAEILLKLLVHAERCGEIGARTIFVEHWLADYEGQTGAQKTREFAFGQKAGAESIVEDDAAISLPHSASTTSIGEG